MPAEQGVAGFPVRHTSMLARMDELIGLQNTGGTVEAALGLPAVFGAVRLITSTVQQLPVTVTNGPTPEWLRRPRRYGGALDSTDLWAHVVSGMALRGHAFLRCIRVGESWRLDALRPEQVQVDSNTDTPVVDLRYRIAGQQVDQVPVSPSDAVQGRPYVLHIPYQVTDAHPEGLGPLQAARLAMSGYLDTESHAASLFESGTHSGGRLETEQDIPPDTAVRWQDQWVTYRKTGKIPVLGAGLSYSNDIINARDAQWVEARQFNQTQVFMMYGIPPDVMGAALTGSASLTYSNSRDNDRRFRRNCLAAFTQQLEDSLSLLLPPGRNVAEEQRVEFDYSRWEGSGAYDDQPADPAGP